MISRPQLDEALALLRAGQAPELGQALVRSGHINPDQLHQLRPGSSAGSGSEAGSQWSEAATLHDGPAQVAPPGGPLGAFTPAGSSAFGAPPASGSAFSAPPAGSGFGMPHAGPGDTAFGAPGGSAFAPPGSALGGGPGGTAFGGGPGGTAFGGGPGGTAFGGGPGGTAFGGGPGSAFGGGAGSAFGGMAGSAFGSSPMSATTPVEDAGDEQIGEWLVERELARGGMGVVYLGARNGTKAAIKVMLQTNGTVNARKVKRFLREIESTQKLVHPGIVKILDAGEFRGYPFFAMEYVEGKPLDRMLKDDLDLEIGMEILEKMARAVHYAHEQGVIHRDLKPANVMVRDDMEPKLTDFGLAKDKDHQSVLTKTGAVLGTPYYLSPEQAAGKSKSIDRRADIYSLGVIMYELATGRLPFVGQTTVELYNRIIHDDPVAPTKIKPQLTKQLETVCLKAMAKEVKDRYPNADEFADDLAALLQGGTVKAKPDGRVKRWIKRVKKKGSLSLILIGTSVLLTVVLGGLILRFKNTEIEGHNAAVQLEIDELKTTIDETLVAVEGELKRGRAQFRSDRLPDAVKSADAALAALDGAEARFGKLKYPEENAEALSEEQARTEDARKRARASAVVLRARAKMYRDQKGALEAAQKDLDTILGEKGIRPGDLGALTTQGELHLLKGALNESLQQYDQALKALPTAVRALFGKARVLLYQEELDPAIAALTQALMTLEKPPEPKEGATEFETLADEEKQALQSELLIARSGARLHQGGDQLSKALADAQNAVKAGPKSWRAQVALGRVLVGMGHAFEARDAFDAAVAMASKGSGGIPAGPLIAKAEGLLTLGYADEALESAALAVSRDPSSLLAMVVRAEVEEQRLNYGEAESLAESAQLGAAKRHWRTASRAARVLARLEAAKGNVAEALGHAKTARTLDEFSPDGRLLLARLQLDPYFEGQYVENAENLLKNVVQRQRTNSLEARRGLGRVLLQKFATDPKRALRKFKEAKELDAFDPWTLAALAKVYSLLAEKDEPNKAKHQKEAVKNYIRASRYERDVRRPEGLAYALGLRAEIEARRAPPRLQARKMREAQTAYQRAAWLDPRHAHALTGLASIAMLQGGRKRTSAFLKKALDANPELGYAVLLNAYHLVTVEEAQANATQAADAVARALKKRGKTVELSIKQIFLDATKENPTGDKLVEAIVKISEKFRELRKQDPQNLAVWEAERELVQRLADRKMRDEKVGVLRRRVKQLQREINEEEKKGDERKKRATLLRARVLKFVQAGEGLKAVAVAERAIKAMPYHPEGWRLLARARGLEDDLWGGLSAGLRAAWLDDTHLVALFQLLRRAGTEDPDEARGEIAKHLAKDNEIYPMEDDLKKLLRYAPDVARAINPEVKVSKKQALEAFDQLEVILNHDPTRLLSHAMLGAMGFGVGRDDYAIQHLLFVVTVRPDLGEAAYLAAVAAARDTSGSRRLDVLAIECLKTATRAKFAWKDMAERDPGLKRLRNSPLWQRLESK